MGHNYHVTGCGRGLGQGIALALAEAEANVYGEGKAPHADKTAELIAGTVVFLSSTAAAYINGYTLAVDGGWLAR
jgi:NAD(P)-dependent dehydrogenase (short-subunit alcohol dehydrogenase family)